MATPPINMWEPTHKRPKNITPQHSSTPHWPNTTSQQIYLVLHTVQCMELQQQTTWINSLGMAPQMHIYTHNMPMSSKLRPEIPCIIGAPNQIQTPISPYPALTVQLIEFTYCHDRFPDQALTQKHTKNDPLINIIQNNGWKINRLLPSQPGWEEPYTNTPLKNSPTLTSQNQILKPSWETYTKIPSNISHI